MLTTCKGATMQGIDGDKSDVIQAGVYGAMGWGPAYAVAAFACTNHWMSTDRLRLCRRPSHRKLQTRRVSARGSRALSLRDDLWRALCPFRAP
jgi:hypothetical protein